MTPSALKKYYSRFLNGHQGKLHFAAHSHHFWPDVTREAHLAYWDDCSMASDEKWNKIFSEVIPRSQSHIASMLNLKDKSQIVFAPNTHELTSRLLSLFLGKEKLRILTTDSEFHSWKRQVKRLNELATVEVEFVKTERLLHERSEFINELKNKLASNPDLFFISQVFFDSGLALSVKELEDLQAACSKETIMVVDGYHGFAAVPTDLSSLEGKIFYLAGGYKYAQAGEGAGFMVVPRGDWRPAYTGWFAEFGELSKPSGTETGYTRDALAFMGATQDFSGLYRLNAVWDLFSKEGITVTKIHELILKHQLFFLSHLPQDFVANYQLTPLFDPELPLHGHFLTYEAATEEGAQEVQDKLKKENVLIDRRGKRLRFGFGLYQDENDILSVSERLKKLANNT